jgi:hypothetical protein
MELGTDSLNLFVVTKESADASAPHNLRVDAGRPGGSV